MALDFALDFIRAFEAESRSAMESFDGLAEAMASAALPAGTDPPPVGAEAPYLTTKIGFTVIGPNQPFRQAYELAESLSRSARNVTESRIAFYRVTGSEIPDSETQIDTEAQAGGFTLWRAAHTPAQIAAR